MRVDIRFMDPETMEEISIDKITGGLDFGTTRRGSQYIKPVILKNMGTSPATGVQVRGTPLNTASEVGSQDYLREVTAAAWKTFSLLPSRGFVPVLQLPDIGPGQMLVGKKELIEDFANPANSYWVNDILTGHTFSWTGSQLTCTSASSSFTARVDASGWGNNKDVDMIVKFNMPKTERPGGAFTMFGFRMNCLGNEKGYLLNIKRQTTDNIPELFCEIRKGAGLKSDNNPDYGTTLATSTPVPWVADFTPLRVKVFTNEDGLPEIKVWYNNTDDSSASVIWSGNRSSWVDLENTFRHPGGISVIFGTGVGGIYALDHASLITEDPEGKIYIRTVVGDDSEDSVVFRSAMEVSYND